jgi:hypothetical protein
MATGIELITKERIRQMYVEGYDNDHDVSEHQPGDIAQAAAVYALSPEKRNESPYLFSDEGDGDTSFKDLLWPFDDGWFKPSPDDRIRELVKAGAMIAAEIDRLLFEQKQFG